MVMLEYEAKQLVSEFGVAVPQAKLVSNPSEAHEAAKEIGPCILKAQIPCGGRTGLGAVRHIENRAEARLLTRTMLGSEIAGHNVESLLIEEKIVAVRELYAAVKYDQESDLTCVLFASHIEGESPVSERLCRVEIDDSRGLTDEQALQLVATADLADHVSAVAMSLIALYWAFRNLDADTLETDPLAVTAGGRVVALNCRLILGGLA